MRRTELLQLEILILVARQPQLRIIILEPIAVQLLIPSNLVILFGESHKDMELVSLKFKVRIILKVPLSTLVKNLY
nr:LysM [Cloning vector NZ3900/pNZ8110-napA-lysM]APW83825.1 LysM [Cloning vector NZ3900/pNZ8110-lysM]